MERGIPENGRGGGMSHFNHPTCDWTNAAKVLFATVILMGAATVNIFAQTNAPITRIELNPHVYIGHKDTVRVTLEQNTGNMSYDRFELTIMYDTAALTYLSGWMGEFVDSCGWESYSVSEVTEGIITISAQADPDGVPPAPACYLDAEEAVLAALEFQVTDDFAYGCLLAPVKFYWENCEDNMYWSSSTDWIYVSDQVTDYDSHFGYTNITEDDALPTLHGAPDSCAAITEGGPRARWMDFFNGGSDIVCEDSIPRRGDLNLNGLSYENDDYVLYGDYFLFGLSVFDIDLAAQISQSDVNLDNEFLTLRDFVYLYRITIGDALPLPEPQRQPSDTTTAQIVQDTAASTVELNYSGILAAVYLEFSGEIIPELTPNVVNMFLQYRFDGSHTVVLISPDPPYFEPLLTGGPLIVYTGEGVLVSAEVSERDGLLPVGVNIYTGFPLDIDGAVYLINYIFAGGYPPIPLEAGDVNCDGYIDIDDVVYLIEYIFAGGPEPYVDCP